MRLFRLGVGIAAVLAASTASLVAAAAPSKGDTGGKGGPGPENSTQSGAEGTASTPVTSVDTTEIQYRNRSTQNPDEAAARAYQEKPWEVAATYELHRLFIQEDLNGAGSQKVFQLLGVSAKYLLTPNDAITLFGGATEGYLADPTESGVRAQDLSLQYAHVFTLPEKFKLRAAGSVTAPISYFSQLASNITTPSISVGLSRRFGDLSVSATVRGAYFWDRYTTPESLNANNNGPTGGDPNTKYVLGGLLSAEYNLPFHRPLSFGIAASDTYYWYYDVGQCPANSGNPTCQPVKDPQFSNQPWQQSYGGEIYGRYALPDLAGFRSDLTVAVGNSNPNFVLHDGIVHPYLLFRDTAEVYFALAGRY
jgi:hypothetical protein